MTVRAMACLSVLIGGLAGFPAMAGVRPELAAKLDSELTPLGGLRAGDAAGRVPAWSGDSAGAAGVAGETPLFVIDRDNAARYAEQLGEGQLVLLAALPESYSLPVYPAHRLANAPAAFIAGTRANATAASIEAADAPPQAAVAGIPFPILSTKATDAGLEAIWNHRLRWRGAGRSRVVMQVTSSTRGDLGVTRLREKLAFRPLDTADGRKDPVLSYLLRGVIDPPRLAGTVKLVYDTLKGPPLAWQRSPNQPKFEKTGGVGDDTAMIGSEGLFDEDQQEGFSGSPARYDWKLLGTRALYMPYDATDFEGAAPDDIFGPRHIRPGLARYELHRVRVLEARLKPQLIAPFARRVLYLDEDSWQVLAVDLYDRADTLARMQEVHTRVAADGALLPTLEVAYDLRGKRYFAAATTNRDGPVELTDFPAADFDPGKSVLWARRAGIVPATDPGR